LEKSPSYRELMQDWTQQEYLTWIDQKVEEAEKKGRRKQTMVEDKLS